MRFVPSDEDTMLRDAARRFLAAPPNPDADRWTEFAEMGWLMTAVPEEHGGLGGDLYPAAIVAEELGRSAAPQPFVEMAVTAAQLFLELAPGRLGALMTGVRKSVLAHGEAEARGDVTWCATRAEPIQGGYRLTGTKLAVVGAPEADELLISADVPGQGITLFAIQLPMPMLSYMTVDGRSCADIRMDNLFAPTEAVLGPVGAALPAIERAVDHAMVMLGADMVGAMQASLDMTKEYLLTRRQYGSLIGDFQALRHRLADMFIETEQSRSILLRAVGGLSLEREERAALASAAKALIAQAARFVTGQAIQLHGGIGVTEECPVGRYFARAVVYDARMGSSEAHIGRFAALTAE